MATASRSLATAQWRARFASGLLRPSYTTSWDTTPPVPGDEFDARRFEGETKLIALVFCARSTTGMKRKRFSTWNKTFICVSLDLHV
jgi:hypothetical protein